MTNKITGVIAAGSLAIGLTIGAASTIVAKDDASSEMADHMRGMTSMLSMMGTDSMADMGSMMSMMGAGSSMGPGSSMSPLSSMSPGDHGAHHASPSPAPTR